MDSKTFPNAAEFKTLKINYEPPIMSSKPGTELHVNVDEVSTFVVSEVGRSYSCFREKNLMVFNILPRGFDPENPSWNATLTWSKLMVEAFREKDDLSFSNATQCT